MANDLCCKGNQRSAKKGDIGSSRDWPKVTRINVIITILYKILPTMKLFFAIYYIQYVAAVRKEAHKIE